MPLALYTAVLRIMWWSWSFNCYDSNDALPIQNVCTSRATCVFFEQHQYRTRLGDGHPRLFWRIKTYPIINTLFGEQDQFSANTTKHQCQCIISCIQTQNNAHGQWFLLLFLWGINELNYPHPALISFSPCFVLSAIYLCYILQFFKVTPLPYLSPYGPLSSVIRDFHCFQFVAE